MMISKSLVNRKERNLFSSWTHSTFVDTKKRKGRTIELLVTCSGTCVHYFAAEMKRSGFQEKQQFSHTKKSKNNAFTQQNHRLCVLG